MDIPTQMQSRDFRAEPVQDRAPQRHIYLMRRVHPSCQHEAACLAHDNHFIAGVTVLSDEQHAGHGKTEPAKFFGDLQNMLGTLRTRLCLRACNYAARGIKLLDENVLRFTARPRDLNFPGCRVTRAAQCRAAFALQGRYYVFDQLVANIG